MSEQLSLESVQSKISQKLGLEDVSKVDDKAEEAEAEAAQEENKDSAAEAETTEAVDTDESLAEDKKDSPKEGSDRWNQLYSQSKQFEEENKKLHSIVSDMAKELDDLKARQAETETQTHEYIQKSEASTIDGQIQALKASKREALETGDFVRADEIDEQVYQLRDKKRELDSKKLRREPTQTKATIDPDLKRDFDVWIAANSEFQDQKKFDELANIEAEVVKDASWSKKPRISVWDEAARRYKAKFEAKSPPVAPVLDPSASRSAASSEDVELTREQINVARRLNLKPEQYARRLKELNRKRGR